MKKLLEAIFGENMLKCMDEIRQLRYEKKMTDENLSFIQNKYPNELHSWEREGKSIKLKMYNI